MNPTWRRQVEEKRRFLALFSATAPASSALAATVCIRRVRDSVVDSCFTHSSCVGTSFKFMRQ